MWGFATATALALFGSDIPLVKRDILSKIPLAGHYFPVKEANHEED